MKTTALKVTENFNDVITGKPSEIDITEFSEE